MRRFETGKHALLRSSLISDDPSVLDKQGGRGTWMRTSIKVHGKGCSLYRAIDRDGNFVDCMLSQKRDMDAAKRFFCQAVAVVGHTPERVTTDGHDSYPRAIREILGSAVLHRCNPYLNNRLEQDHRGIRTAVLPDAWMREASRQQHASVEHLTRYASSSAFVLL